jgi:magnesium chelatase family protein
MNPCPCGWRGAAAGRCRCPAARTARYRERISGPLLDRIDLRIEMSAVSPEELGGAASEGTAEIRERVGAARAFQRSHSRGPGARLPVAALGRDCALEPAARGLLERALRRFPTSARSHHRLLRVARTIADLDARPVITEAHLAEAMSLRRALEVEDAGA